ncbi:MAG: 16S rRNA (cytidine(1402)-2'-O)-methyltransferase [Patescibacteria group bacterium]
MSILYVVSTPIGNLEDVTLRALRVLKEVDIILCEDTRVTQRLLKHYGIVNKQLSTYNEKRSGVKFEKIIEWLKEGKKIALVSDAGTPAISDPGAMLVEKVREEFKVRPLGDSRSDLEIKIESVPGPSALTAALSVAGIPVSDFLFLGFLPHKKGRETLFKEIAESKRTVVFYESPHRIMKTLASLSSHLAVKPPSGRRVAIARELTKIYEQVVFGTPSELTFYFEKNKDKIRGEFVVIVSPR